MGNKIHQIEGIIEVSQKFGMNTLNMRLSEMVKLGVITDEMALGSTANPEQLQKLLIDM